MYLTTNDAKRFFGTPLHVGQAVVRVATDDCLIWQRPTDAVG